MTRIPHFPHHAVRTLVAAFACAAFPVEVTHAQARPAIDKLFATWDRADSPGCSVGVVQDGKFVYQRGYGSANLDYGIPNSPDMVY